MSGPREGGWASWGLLREAVLRLHHSYEAVPRAARRRWWWTLLAGFVAVQLLALGLVVLTRRLERAGALAWEDDFLRGLAAWEPLSFSLGMWLEGTANGFVMWALMLFAAGVAAWRRRPLRALSILMGYTLVYAHIAAGWIAWRRERPQLIAGGVGDPGGIFQSFPSGHMLQGVFAHGILIYFWITAARSPLERGFAVLAWIVLGVLVAAGRLRLGSHWPSDVLAGGLLASAWLAAVIVALRRVER